MDVREEVYNSLKNATIELAPTVEMLGKREEAIKSGVYSSDYVRDTLEPERDGLRKQIQAAGESALQDAQAIVDRYKEQERAALTLDPEALTPDFALLTSGIPLTQRDVCAILDRSRGNKTMTQLAHRFAQKNEIQLPQAYTYAGDAEVRQAEIAADGMADIAKRYVRGYMGTAGGMDMLNKFFQVGA